MRKLIVKTRESNAYTAGEVCLPAYFAAFCAQGRDKNSFVLCYVLRITASAAKS